MIQLTGVFVKKGDIEILKDINLNLHEGQKYAVVGPNGSGKSTLLDLLASKVFPLKGQVQIDKGFKISLLPRDYRFNPKARMAYQYYQQRYHADDSSLGPTLLEFIQDQIVPVGTVHEKSVTLAAPKYSREEIEEIAQTLQIDHLLKKKTASLSNGEGRRGLLAYTLLEKPDILLLDNPFSGLDQQSKQTLKEIISKLPMAVVLVCDEMELPSGFEQVIYLNNGMQVNKAYSPKPLEIDKILKFFKISEKSTSGTCLELKNINISFGDRVLFKNLDWVIQHEEKWALTGPNGSGKTSLLSLIIGDNPKAYSNEVYFWGQRRGSGMSIWELKSKIGFMSPEIHQYFPKSTTVFKAIASGYFDTMGLFKKLDVNQEMKVKELIALFGLQDLENRALHQLSNGEQRLTLLARALIKNPPLLILDEPCQGLDHQHMVFIRDLINTLSQELGKTLIYVSHIPEEIPSCVNKFLSLA